MKNFCLITTYVFCSLRITLQNRKLDNAWSRAFQNEYALLQIRASGRIYETQTHGDKFDEITTERSSKIYSTLKTLKYSTYGGGTGTKLIEFRRKWGSFWLRQLLSSTFRPSLHQIKVLLESTECPNRFWWWEVKWKISISQPRIMLTMKRANQISTHISMDKNQHFCSYLQMAELYL